MWFNWNLEKGYQNFGMDREHYEESMGSTPPHESHWLIA